MMMECIQIFTSPRLNAPHFHPKLTSIQHKHSSTRFITAASGSDATPHEPPPPPPPFRFPDPTPPAKKPNPIFSGPRPTIILAGFYLEEIPVFRELLDAAGGQDITLLPCMPWLLDLSVDEALDEGEPQWDKPMPDTWVHGGGWGSRKVIIFNDIMYVLSHILYVILHAITPLNNINNAVH